jgi:transposase
LSPCVDQDDQRLEAAVLFTGWDWASASHAVTILDSAGEVVDRCVFAHTEQDLDTMLARLASHGSPAELPVAIERADGLVVDRLLAAGHPVVAIDPGAFHAARPRWGAAGAKTDPGDSHKLADYLRTDGHRLRRLEPVAAVTRELQALVRLRDDHVAAKTAASNQLGALLDAHWPGAKQLFFRLASKITLAFLAEFPTPQAAAQLDQAELAAFCRRHAYRGGRHPAELLERLRSAPRPPVGLDPTVLAQVVGAQVQLLANLLATIAELDQAIGNRLGKHPKVGLLARLPRVGQLSHAQLLAELGPILDRASSAEHAAAQAGAAPVTRASGKTSSVHFRLAANHRARQALHIFADNARHSSPWAGKLYADARARGKRHPKRSGSLGAPGSESSGPAGTPTRPTTRPSTAPNNASQPDHLTQKTEASGADAVLRTTPDGPDEQRLMGQPDASGWLVCQATFGHP